MKDRPETLNTQAINFAANGEYSEAIACFKRALLVEKTNYLIWFNLGVTYRSAGKLEAAKDCLINAYEINPIDHDVLDTLAIVCLALEQIQDALYFCQEGLDLYPMDAHLWNTLGVIYFNQSFYKGAEECFERSLSINPYYYDALYNLRDTYDELGNKIGKQECILRMKSIKDPQGE